MTLSTIMLTIWAAIGGASFIAALVAVRQGGKEYMAVAAMLYLVLTVLTVLAAVA